LSNDRTEVPSHHHFHFSVVRDKTGKKEARQCNGKRKRRKERKDFINSVLLTVRYSLCFNDIYRANEQNQGNELRHFEKKKEIFTVVHDRSSKWNTI
jgi:hypothetical protein